MDTFQEAHKRLVEAARILDALGNKYGAATKEALKNGEPEKAVIIAALFGGLSAIHHTVAELAEKIEGNDELDEGIEEAARLLALSI